MLVGTTLVLKGGKRPHTRPATAGDNAVAGHPLPSGKGWWRWVP